MGEIDELTKDRNAIRNGVCGNAEQLLRDYLENTKMAEVGGDTVIYGPNFGTINFITGGITDWNIDSVTKLIENASYLLLAERERLARRNKLLNFDTI